MTAGNFWPRDKISMYCIEAMETLPLEVDTLEVPKRCTSVEISFVHFESF